MIDIVFIDSAIERNLLIVAPETSLLDAIQQLVVGIDSSNQEQNNQSINYILIGIAQQLVGILTQKDIIKLVAAQTDLAITPISKVMTQPVITLNQNQGDNPQFILAFLEQHSLTYLPIVNDEAQVIGVIEKPNLIQLINSYQLNQYQVNQRSPEEELELCFRLNPSPFCLISLEGYFHKLNPVLINLLGYPEEQLLSQPLINFIHPEDRVITIAKIEQLKIKQTIVSWENRYCTQGGEYRWLLWTAKADAATSMILAAGQDITERKQTQLALEENEARWQLALQGANDGIWDWNVQTNKVFFSHRWKEMLGFKDDEIENSLEEWSKRVHPDDLAEVMQLIQNHFAGQTPFYVSEHRVLCKNGSYKWILDRGQALWDEQGQVIRMAGSHTDITDRKQAELQLQQERDFSDAVIDTVGALVAILNREGEIVRFNHACEQITGYSFAEVKGKSIWEFLINPAEKPAVQAVFARLLTGQLPNQYENCWLGKDGTQHLISWSNTALFDAQGNVEFIIATGIDVTQQRQVWNKLELQYRQTKLLAEVTRKIRMSIELNEILQTTVTEVQHLLACDRVIVVKITPNQTAVPMSESMLSDLPSMLGYEVADPLLIGKSNLSRYRQGKILKIDNLKTASISLDVKRLLQQFNVQAKLVVPILSQHQLKGLLIAHQCYSPRTWQKNEIQLLIQLADQIGVALSQAQLLDHLEEIVSQRTNELSTTNYQLEAEIAERKQTESALRENQQKLAGILDNADEAIISINQQQKIQLFNQGAEKIFGYQAAEVIGQPLDLLIPDTFRQIHRQHVEYFAQSTEQARTMAERNSEVYGLRRDGTKFPAEASIAKLELKEGMLFTVMLKDNTDRKQAEAKLQASQSLLAKAEKIAKIGSWEYDHETNTRSWSDELFNILGFKKDVPLPSCQEILEKVHPDDRLLVKNTLRKGHQEGIAWELNYRLLLADGTIKYLESRGEPNLDSQGKVIKVLETIMDISDRVNTKQSLQRSEEQLRVITDALPILIAYIDAQKHYRYVNRTYETWYGKPRSRLLSIPMSELLGQENYHKILPYIEMALTGKKVTFENQIKAANGSNYWMSATYIPDLDLDGKVKGFFSMVDDITERKAIEQIKSEFISIASHEMRTPLTSIHGVIKLLCASRLGELSPQGKVMADMALRNSDRLVHLVNDILDLERMESGKDRIEKQLCSSHDLIFQAIDTVNSLATQHQIKIEVEVKPIKIMVDGDRIVQTFTNLLSNAIKFSSPQSTVWITSQIKQDWVVFSVKDQGRGIPQHKLDSIFERFQQVDASDSRKKGGTGLGLAICRHIVEQHGGKIWLESKLNEGSIFYFSLPIA